MHYIGTIVIEHVLWKSNCSINIYSTLCQKSKELMIISYYIQERTAGAHVLVSVTILNSTELSATPLKNENIYHIAYTEMNTNCIKIES